MENTGTAAPNKSSIVMLKGSSREFLQTCLDNGWLNGEAAKHTDEILSENTALRRENAILKGRLGEQRKVNKEYRRTWLSALNYQHDTRKQHLTFAAVGLAIALTCLVYTLILYL